MNLNLNLKEKLPWMNNQKKIQFKSLNHDLSIIRQCDVLLTNGTEQFVGLYYNEQYYYSPMVLCKGNGTLNYYLSKVTKMFGIIYLGRCIFNS